MQQMIRAGALVAINSSGGKDSQCITILLSRLVPREQLLVVHAPLGEVEWPGTVEHIEVTLPADVPLVMAPVSSGKTLLDRVEERGMFPGVRQRWCTAEHKRGPIERELRRYLKTHTASAAASSTPWACARRKARRAQGRRRGGATVDRRADSTAIGALTR